ncbi:MAG: hypothetical protein ACREMY_27405, partial [bacterium]
MAALADRLRVLMRCARQGGATSTWLDEAADELVDALLELDSFRRGDRDPRRRRTLSLAQRVARARDAGVAVLDLVERFGKSRPTIYRLLKSHDIVRRARSQMAAKFTGARPP